jgi:PAS domain S-box-containing protein
MNHRPINLLIIENKPGNWSLFEEDSLKSELPLNVYIAAGIAEAKSKLSDHQIQAVIADYSLKDGFCTSLLPLPNDAPLIVMLKEGDEENALPAIKSGANDFLIKDKSGRYCTLLPITISKAIEQKNQSDELTRYRTQLENVVEERTIELIDMYSKLQESETNFRNIFNSTNDGISIVDFDLNFVEANDAVYRRLNVSKEFLATHEILDYIVVEYHESLIEHVHRVRNGQPSGILEIDIISPSDGSILPFEINSVPIVFNQKKLVLSVMRDITERKSHARKLFETIIHTEEIERSRIARDLHDEIGPLISALKIFLTSFLESKDKEKKDKLAKQMSAIVRDLIESVKVISNDMSPHVLVNFGIVAAVENFIDLFSKDIRINFASDIGSSRFPPTVESLIYRILKELINNTIKHAQATAVLIKLEFLNNILKCSYKDNGKGFNWKKLVESPSRGMGINNIITRIRSMGGEYEINVEPGKGFEIIFTLHTIKNAGN